MTTAASPTLAVALTERCLEQPTLAICTICGQHNWLEPLVAFDAADQPICFNCFDAFQHLRRFAHHRALLIEDGQDAAR